MIPIISYPGGKWCIFSIYYIFTFAPFITLKALNSCKRGHLEYFLLKFLFILKWFRRNNFYKGGQTARLFRICFTFFIRFGRFQVYNFRRSTRLISARRGHISDLDFNILRHVIVYFYLLLKRYLLYVMKTSRRVYFEILIIRMFSSVVIKTDVKSNLPHKAVIFKKTSVFCFFQNTSRTF